ncbi:hypothetical protein HYU92_01955 [Candidatus Curtissbacteria bacterium]|nr:hypothetical protein [Candidatus Curtissbacteria bacterium]
MKLRFSKSSLKVILPVLNSIALVFLSVTSVFAWPTRGPEVDCQHIHWEMQNDRNQSNQFVGRVFEPIQETDASTEAPYEWGILDATFNNLSGNVVVRASISMGGDTRNLSRTINCGEPSATPTPSPSPSPSVSPSPTASPSPSATPSPSPLSLESTVVSPSPSPSPTGGTNNENTNNNNQSQPQTQTQNNQTVNVTVETGRVLGVQAPTRLPETGADVLAALLSLGLVPAGIKLARYSSKNSA